MFEDAGVELPPHDYTNPDWTYEQLLEKATALTKRSGSGPAEQFGVYFGNGFWGNASVLWSFGTQFMDDIEAPTKVTFGSPETVDGHQWLVDLRVKHQVSASVAEEQGIPADTQFSTGKLAMFATGGWTWPFLSQPEITDRIHWEVYPLPKGPKGQYCQLAGNSYGMNAATPHVEESWQLLKHVTVGKGAETFFTAANCKGLPATWTLANNPAFLSWFSPESKKTAMEVHKMGTWFPKHPQWQEVAAERRSGVAGNLDGEPRSRRGRRQRPDGDGGRRDRGVDLICFRPRYNTVTGMRAGFGWFCPHVAP